MREGIRWRRETPNICHLIPSKQFRSYLERFELKYPANIRAKFIKLVSVIRYRGKCVRDRCHLVIGMGPFSSFSYFSKLCYFSFITSSIHPPPLNFYSPTTKYILVCNQKRYLTSLRQNMHHIFAFYSIEYFDTFPA